MERLAYPAAKPIHNVHLHSRFCSFIAVIFCVWWVASLLHFQTSVINFPPASVDSPSHELSAVQSHDSSQVHLTAADAHSKHEPIPGHSSTLHTALQASSPPYTSNVLLPSTLKRSSFPVSSSSVTTPSSTMPSTRTSVPSFSSSISPSSSSLSSSHPSSSSSPSSSSLSPSSSSSSSLSSPSSSLSPSSSSSLFSSPSSSLVTPSVLQEHAYSSYLPRSKERSPSPSPSLHVPNCDGKYVYIQSLPSMFNEDLTSNCTHHSPIWANFCSYASNGGLGPILQDDDGVLTPPHDGIHSWYNTDQFILDVIFHSRMKNYKCLTNDSSKAELIYVPFYAGLDITRYLWRVNISVRDYLSNALADWLPEQPEWGLMKGRDHFLVTGKISWDFRRASDNEDDWGNKLLEMPVLQDVSVLTIEKGPVKASHVEHGIPYPTYFHPHTDSEVIEWQNRMRALKRENLFAFAGASRPEFTHSIRGELIEQCRTSTFCKLLECNRGKSGCNSPTTVMKLFQESHFCLQPAGDSYTRRSVFDSMLSGCIPVLFHPYTVYAQYSWHLPKNYSTYSVFIPEEEIKAQTAVIERILRRIPAAQVEEMREKVIRLIPTLIYAHPDHKLEKVKDAFDVAIEALLMKVRASKRSVRERTAMMQKLRHRHAASVS